MSAFKLEIVESELKIVLESLTEMEHRMATVCDTSDDEDAIAVGINKNDMLTLRGVIFIDHQYTGGYAGAIK